MFSHFLSKCKLRVLCHAELQKQRGNNWDYTRLKMCEACRKVKSNQTKILLTELLVSCPESRKIDCEHGLQGYPL